MKASFNEIARPSLGLHVYFAYVLAHHPDAYHAKTTQKPKGANHGGPAVGGAEFEVVIRNPRHHDETGKENENTQAADEAQGGDGVGGDGINTQAHQAAKGHFALALFAVFYLEIQGALFEAELLEHRAEHHVAFSVF